MEEYESIRLSDYEGLTQLEASKRLNVSRPTFTRIYDAARKKVAKAFVENKSISIEGGDVVFKENWYYCNHCHSVFKIKPEDYDIRIPKTVMQKIAESLEVTVNVTLEEL